ncbi:MAG: c-type cytochrome [Nitrospiria bacterium]
MERVYIGFIGIFLILVSCTQTDHKSEAPVEKGLMVQGATPAEFVGGESLFRSHCEQCHGAKGAGTDRGPSFISPIYHPDHHGDDSFILAARNGSKAHHWNFGDMPPIPNVKDEEVRQIVQYVRWLQRSNKVY